MWELNKVILSDSFGESFSLCRNIELESDIPVQVKLYPGDCYEEELLFAATSTTTTTTRKPKSTRAPNNKSGEIIELGRHTIIGNDSSKAASERSPSLVSDTWKPIETTQSVVRNANDTASPNITENDDFLNIGERMMSKAKTEKRSFGVIDDDADSMRSIRDDSSSLEEAIDEGIDEDMMEVNANDAEEKFVTVQLFPYRLGDIFERAEKYARSTLFPLLSEQISNIFSVETKTEKASSKNNAITIVSKSPSKSTRKFEEENNDLVMSASSYVTNEEMTMNNNNNLNTVQTLQKLDKSQLGDNNLRPPIQLLNNRKPEDDKIEKESVKIDLPTYKPPIENDKIFIPIDRGSFNT